MANKWIGKILASIATRKRYKKSLIIVLVTACLPSVLIGISFYFIGTNQIGQEVIDKHRRHLEQARKQMDEQFAHIELSAAHWGLTLLYQKQDDLFEQFLSTHELYNSLFIMKGSSTLIDQVYLYLEDRRFLISYDEGMRPLNEEQNAELQSLLADSDEMFWANIPFPNSNPTLALSISPRSDQGSGALIFKLNENKVDDLIKEYIGDQEGLSFIMHQNGDWIIAGMERESARSEQEEFLREEVLKRKTEQDSFITKWKHDNLSVSFDQIPRLRSTWIYVTASTVDHLTKPVQLMSRTIILVSGSGIVMAIILSWLGSRRMYLPIQRLTNVFKETGLSKMNSEEDEFSFIEKQWRFLLRESNELQDSMDKQLPILKEGFFLQLVQGHLSTYSEGELRERMLGFGWDVENKSFSIMIIRIVGLFDAEGKFLENDRQLVTYAASNIIGELAEPKIEDVAVLNFQDLTIGLLVASPVEKHWKQFKNELFKLADEITEKINMLLKFKVLIGIGNPTDLMRDIPGALQEVRQMMHYRILEKNNQILDIDELVLNTSEASYYPEHIEKEIHHALRRGDSMEAKLLIGQFFKQLSDHHVTEFVFLHSSFYLLGNLLQTFIQLRLNIHSLYKGENLYEQLIKMREHAEIQVWFQEKVIEPFVHEFTESHHSQNRNLIRQAVDMIHNNYMNDISLEYCADQLGVHQVRLSKGFKQVVGQTFIDYLTKVRIDKSKELLSTSDMKINDIAKHVGYQPTYFNKIFKKHETITAGEYRNLHKN